jgi:hypothetical protein
MSVCLFVHVGPQAGRPVSLSSCLWAAAAGGGSVSPFVCGRWPQEAEAWGSRSLALHCDPKNASAFGLYLAAGYKSVAQEPLWQPLLEVRKHR